MTARTQLMELTGTAQSKPSKDRLVKAAQVYIVSHPDESERCHRLLQEYLAPPEKKRRVLPAAAAAPVEAAPVEVAPVEPVPPPPLVAGRAYSYVWRPSRGEPQAETGVYSHSKKHHSGYRMAVFNSGGKEVYRRLSDLAEFEETAVPAMSLDTLRKRLERLRQKKVTLEAALAKFPEDAVLKGNLAEVESSMAAVRASRSQLHRDMPVKERLELVDRNSKRAGELAAQAGRLVQELEGLVESSGSVAHSLAPQGEAPQAAAAASESA